jgi:pyruvate,orthophosphate dikinase
MAKKYIYKYTEGDGKNKMLLGGKGANLCEMTQIGLRVPPGFVITTEACLDYIASNRLPEGLMGNVRENIGWLEKETGKQFGGTNPLLVSVRSGSAMSMPGMMDTILNLGLNDTTLSGLIKLTGNERFGYDAYRRFIQLFGKIALGIEDCFFDEHFEAIKRRAGIKVDLGLSANDLLDIVTLFLQVVQEQTGKQFPQDPYEQLDLAVKAVFNSWMGQRAVDYRREFKITPDMANGTAVNVVTMVFGNMGNDCATGVGFTRDPGTGENVMYGEYLVNAQGEDVVAGIRTPKPVLEMKDEMPEMFRQLVELRNKLEDHYSEVQDYEYTIEKGVLYCLQTRNGKMNAAAMVRSSVEMANESLINREKALLRIDPEALEQMMFPQLDKKYKAAPASQGMGASPGAASGKIVFDADTAVKRGRGDGEKIILVREETKPEDIHGFFAAVGILTSRGGKTSHAAVVARGMGKPCIVGAEDIEVNVHQRQAIIGDTVLHEGDLITIDGGTGRVFLGEIPTVEPEFTPELRTLLSWADEIASLKVMANADTPEAAQRASNYGAMGIGLCRTERMFNATDRLPIVLEMILAETTEDREVALAKLLPMQRSDFKEIFRVMAPRPVTVRLLDPPIHEFLPSEQTLLNDIEHLRHLYHTTQGLESISQVLRQVDPKAVEQLGILNNSHLVSDILSKKEEILQKVRALHEINPMLGHRGVRLGLTYPEIYKMQIRAILEAAAECVQEKVDVHPEIMVPQVCTAEELNRVRALVDEVLPDVEAKYAVKVDFEFGTMIEVVRACLRAEEIAEAAEFFSFGTNDLTQATFSFSREDAENKFLPFYNQSGILKDNPFEALDTKGVGQLMSFAVKNGRKVRNGLKVGICGEQGGHPRSMRFCHYANLTYVSCSSPRVPIARLAAAHAKLLEENYQP